jgi:hypothetical protein
MKYLLYIFIFALISCSNDYKINSSFVVYETFLSKLSKSNTSTKIFFLNESKPLFIKNLTPHDFHKNYGKDFPTLPKEAIEDFLDKNKKSISLKWKPILTDISFLSKSDVERKKNVKNYPFKEKDAKFYVEISQVGFSKDKNHAVLSFYQNCGVLCGSGGIVHFIKRDEKYWVLEESTTLLLQ